MVELLKQPQYQPMSAEDQVAVIWVHPCYLDRRAGPSIRVMKSSSSIPEESTHGGLGLRDRKESPTKSSRMKKAAEEFKGLFAAK